MLWWGLKVAGAEGFTIGANPDGWVTADTVLYLDVLDASLETFFWDGTGTATLTSPDGKTAIKLDPGEFAPNWEVAQEGAWEVTLSESQTSGFDLSVLEYYDSDGNGQIDYYTGRLFSYRWEVTVGAGDAITGGLYAVATLSESSALAEVYYIGLEGLAGDTLTVMANRTGSTDLPAWSTPFSLAEPQPAYRLYFNHPEEVTRWSGDLPDDPQLSVTTEATMCDSVLHGEAKALFSARISAPSAGVLVCDLDGDGVFSMSGGTDLALYDWYSEGDHQLGWDGTDATGALVKPGEYACTLRLLSMPIHVLTSGVSTAYPGLGILLVNADETLRPRLMQWNDRLLVDALGTDADLISTGSPPAVATGGEGVSSDTTLVPDESAHGWGNFSDPSRGEYGWVDTWTWSSVLTASDSLKITVLSSTDDDGDGLIGGHESCLLGTDPDDDDSDGDGLDDGTEVGDVDAPWDTDGDTVIDALDDDDDDDGVMTAREVSDTAALGLMPDLDGDTLDSWHDPDADGDGWPDGDEPDDLNGDGIPAYLDPDEHPEEVTLYGTFRGGVGACATAPAAGLLPVLLALLSVLRLRTSPRAPTPPRAPPAAAGSRSVPARGGHTGGCAPATTGRDRRGQTAR